MPGALKSASQTSQFNDWEDQLVRKSKKKRISFKVRVSEPWQLQTAKARFSELFRRARTEGPQLVTRQGKEQVIVMSAEQFEQLTSRSKQPKSLARFFAESPLVGSDIDLTRVKESGRDVSL